MSELSNVKITSSPHLRSSHTTQDIMLLVTVALLPAAGFGVYNFGLDALIVLLLTVASCVISEYAFAKITKRKVTVSDFSAVVTGLLLGMNLPSTVPFWLPIIGGMFAIFVVKMIFGGIGQNFVNPALGARCFLIISFSGMMNNFVTDTYTTATPLSLLKEAQKVGDVGSALKDLDIMSMIIGRTPGVIGETSMIAIIIGAAILVATGVIDLKIPATYIVTFVVFLLVFGPSRTPAYIAAQLAGGGLMLGAFFMATDYTTCPITPTGKYVYGIFIGVLTGVFRIYGSPEGVSFAIILGNIVVPLIERFTRPLAFGIVKEKKKAKEA